jgi:hypothetical protein
MLTKKPKIRCTRPAEAVGVRCSRRHATSGRRVEEELLLENSRFGWRARRLRLEKALSVSALDGASGPRGGDG